MKEETAIELLRMATELTITTIETEGVITPHHPLGDDSCDVTMVFKDCSQSILRAYKEMTKN